MENIGDCVIEHWTGMVHEVLDDDFNVVMDDINGEVTSIRPFQLSQVHPLDLNKVRFGAKFTLIKTIARDGTPAHVLNFDSFRNQIPGQTQLSAQESKLNTIINQWIGYVDEFVDDTFSGILHSAVGNTTYITSFELCDVHTLDLHKLRLGAWFTLTITMDRDNFVDHVLNFNSSTYTKEEIDRARREAEEFQDIVWE